jgi:hypothetical protein
MYSSSPEPSSTVLRRMPIKCAVWLYTVYALRLASTPTDSCKGEATCPNQLFGMRRHIKRCMKRWLALMLALR